MTTLTRRTLAAFPRLLYLAGGLLTAAGLGGCQAARVYQCECGMPAAYSGRWTQAAGGCEDCGQLEGCDCPLDASALAPKGWLHHTVTCGSGCGEIYWGEWLSDPPTCDPCDTCGNWIGPQPCPPRPFQGWGWLWGHRWLGGEPPSHCSSCEAMIEGDMTGGLLLESGNSSGINGGSVPEGIPTPATPPAAAPDTGGAPREARRGWTRRASFSRTAGAAQAGLRQQPVQRLQRPGNSAPQAVPRGLTIPNLLGVPVGPLPPLGTPAGRTRAAGHRVTGHPGSGVRGTALEPTPAEPPRRPAPVPTAPVATAAGPAAAGSAAAAARPSSSPTTGSGRGGSTWQLPELGLDLSRISGRSTR